MEMSYRFYTFLTATFLLVVAVIQAEVRTQALRRNAVVVL